jgi:hypothetical protein
MAASARSVASFSVGWLSPPASSRVGADSPSKWPGRYVQPSSARHCLGTGPALASMVGQRGPDRREATSPSVIPTIPTSTSRSAVSASPAASAASTASIAPAG